MNKVIQRALEIVGSQKRLADICGVSQPAVHKWLNGGSVSPEKVTAIVRAADDDGYVDAGGYVRTTEMAKAAVR